MCIMHNYDCDCSTEVVQVVCSVVNSVSGDMRSFDCVSRALVVSVYNVLYVGMM